MSWIDPLPGSKTGLVDYILCDPQQNAFIISKYEEQFIVTKVSIK